VRRLAAQFVRYLLSGGAAAAVHLVVLVAAVELVRVAKPLASAVGFCCAVLVNYGLQHRFVFGRTSRHGVFLPRYVAVTLGTLVLNVALFWLLTQEMGVPYVLSQVLTIGLIVPVNFTLNRTFTFAALGPERA
jgi:putative flippase GtrA